MNKNRINEILNRLSTPNDFDITKEELRSFETNNVITSEEYDYFVVNYDIILDTFKLCADCDQYHYEGDLTYIDFYDKYVCSDCMEDYYVCNDCGALMHREDMTIVYHYGEEVQVCDTCLDCNYSYCDECNDYHDNDEFREDSNGDWWCSDCYERYHSTELYSYHEFSDWHLYHLPEEQEEPPYYIGYELEVDNGDYQSDCIDRVTQNLNAVCMHDGSLGYKGFEIVSHPQSYKYITSEYTIRNMKNTFEYLISNGYRSHDTSTCGLHFHVTRPDDATIDRILFLLETYKDEFIKFSRRNESQLSRWCAFTSDSTRTDNLTKSLYYIKKNKVKGNRYMVLNLTNSNTIEFRLFKGTLNIDTFLASVELVNNIVSLCSNKKININNITWTRLTSTPYVKKYCEEHNITTDRRPQNDSSLEKAIKNKEKMIKKQLKETLKALIQDYNNFKTIRLTEKDKNIYGATRDSSMYLTTLVNEIDLLNGFVVHNNTNSVIKNNTQEFLTYYPKAYRRNELEKIIEMIKESE